MRGKNLILVIVVYLMIGGLTACNGIDTGKQVSKKAKNNIAMDYKINKTEAEWMAQLGENAFQVLRKKGTERPFTSEYETLWDSGVYVCKGCGEELFSSTTKFDAGCGWPSFYQSIDKSKVKEILDNSHGMSRVEVVCNSCGGHLGHVFNDGYNQPTGLRYCINGVSLGFVKKQ
jgi:peptide-methionine (R)-S-oxide reductase